MKAMLRAAGVLVLTACTATTVFAQVNASEVPRVPTPVEVDRTLSKQLGVTLEEVANYRKAEQDYYAHMAIANIDKSKSAGIFLRRNADTSYSIVEMRKGSTERNVPQDKYLDDVLSADYSTAELKSMREALVATAKKLSVGRSVHSVGTDIPANKIVLTVETGNEGQARTLITSAGVPYDVVTIRSSRVRPSPAVISHHIQAS